MIDLSDPTLDDRLRRRNAEGRFEISEIELVTTIRALQIVSDQQGMQRLSAVLLDRCTPLFKKHSHGLQHRPDLREEAIANMAERVLREALDLREKFMTQNFVHYLRCLCVDEFHRTLRMEGLIFRRDESGQPAGRPQHVPRTLIESLHPAPVGDEGMPVSDVADPHDQYEELHAEEECMRILTYVPEPLDRTIVVLRAIQHWKWDDIAHFCHLTERTVRSHYQQALDLLRATLTQGDTQDLPLPTQPTIPQPSQMKRQKGTNK